jgi:hypothetical protein
LATRKVRLDDEAEAALRQIRDATGLPISEALKRGLRSLQKQIANEATRTPFEIYQELDLSPGGHAIAPSTDVRRRVRQAIRKELRR